MHIFLCVRTHAYIIFAASSKLFIQNLTHFPVILLHFCSQAIRLAEEGVRAKRFGRVVLCPGSTSEGVKLALQYARNYLTPDGELHIQLYNYQVVVVWGREVR